MNTEVVELLVIIGVPLASALVLVLLRGRGVQVAGWIAGLAAAISLAAVLALLPALRREDALALGIQWIPTANVQLSIRLDWLSFPFLLTVTVVTLLAVVYAWGYHHPDERTPSPDGSTGSPLRLAEGPSPDGSTGSPLRLAEGPIFYALLLLFAVGMMGSTLADGMFLFYVFWELMLLASCAMVAVWGSGERRGEVALKYFIFTHVGSLMVLVGLLVLYDAIGSDSLAVLRAGLTLDPGLTTFVVLMFIIGFCVKMAIFPLHLWLPDTHAVAPMPVTVMLAAAMLSMGTYGILRFPFSIFSLEQMAPFASWMMIAGIVSEIYGAFMVMAERDVKRIVAYSSVSQMGYILFGLGTLDHDGISGAILHVVFHAIIKALLFMDVGLVMRATGRRDIKALGGLGRAMPVAATCAGVGALALAGTPAFCIFDSEWMIFSGGFHTTGLILPILALFGSLLTVVYALWIVGSIFFGERPDDLTVKPLPWAMIAPTVLLAVLALVAGLFPASFFDWSDRALGLILGGNW
jgi:NADH-quinone oxidoreductase subunit M